MAVTAYRADIIYTSVPERYEVYPASYLLVRDGLVEGIYTELPEKYRGVALEDFSRSLLIPAFVDLHVHAPQFLQSGLGMDKELIAWLNEHTFPLENRFADPLYAREAYDLFTDALIYHGTLRACVLGTVHRKSTEILFQCLAEKGIGAFVGKVNMDRHCPDYLRENTADSLRETEELALAFSGHHLVKPILTPRFAPTSSEELLEGLGRLSQKYNLPVQSHLAENRREVAWVKELFPAHPNYASVYRHFGLLGHTPSLMAHGIYLGDDEVELLRNSNVTLVHCPDANINLSSGIMPARRWLKAGIRLALGSDVGAGHTLAMNRVMRSAVQLSKLQNLAVPGEKPLTSSEAFYLGTRAGGEFFGKVGSFEKGFSFDALVIADDPFTTAGLSPEERLQKFIYAGEPSEITARFVNGTRL